MPKRLAAWAWVRPQRFRSRNNISTNIEPMAEDMQKHHHYSPNHAKDRTQLAGTRHETGTEGQGTPIVLLLSEGWDAAHGMQRCDHKAVDGNAGGGHVRSMHLDLVALTFRLQRG
jgi:hypothetical protein